MKIGILTFHCAHNYGAVLQAYALQEKIKELGHEVEIIDYRPNYIEIPYKIFSFKRLITKYPIILLKRIISEALTINKRILRHKSFSSFISNRLNLSEKVKKKKIPGNYDLYILGSDQIWNPMITKGFDNVFFGFFKTKQTANKITYAASMADTGYLYSHTEYIKKAFLNFNAISVREEILTKHFKKFTNKEIVNVLDPTLVVEKKIWDKIQSKPIFNHKYVLVYEVKADIKTLKVAQKIAKQINGEIIFLKAFLDLNTNRNSKDTASPEEFLGWIKHANCVVTTSFHATAFSVVFEIPFYTIKLDDALNNRSTAFLKSIGLEERIINDANHIVFSEIDYKNSIQKLNRLKENSLLFLKKNLSTEIIEL